jgi:hypothetical protein
MPEINYTWHTLPNVGYMMMQLPEEVLSVIRSEIDEIYNSGFSSSEEYNKQLAGHINDEYTLPKSMGIVEEYSKALAIAHNEEFDYLKSIPEIVVQTADINLYEKIKLNSLWVNFQQKYDFNPLHSHGGIWSFVIWMNIPYNLEEEKKRFPKLTEKQNMVTNFQFAYTDTLGNISQQTIPVDQSFEGKMCLFPASMRHFVNPFYTSDSYRVSVAGNIALETI